MSYQILDVRLPRVNHYITDTEPGVYDLGALSGCDAMTLSVTFIVLGFSGIGLGSAKLQQSWTEGLTWNDVSIGVTPVISANGEYQITVDGSSGMLSPKVRLVVTPAAGDTFYLAKIYRSFSTSHVMMPKSIGVTGAVGSSYPMTFSYGAGGVYTDTHPIYDTTTPTNNRGLPSVILKGEGAGAFVAGQAASASSFPVTMSTEQEVKLTTIGTNTGAIATARNAAFNKGVVAMGEMDDSGTTIATEDNSSPVRITAYRAMHQNLRDSSGNELLGQKAMADSIPVTMASNQPAVPMTAKKTVSACYRYALTVPSPLNTGAWTQVVASTAAGYDRFQVFNSSESSIQVAVGGAGAEVLVFIIQPGGDSWDYYVAYGSRISIQPYVNCTDGEIIINMLGV